MLDSFAWCFLDQLSDQSFQQYSRNLLLLKLFCDIAPSSCAVRLCVCVCRSGGVCRVHGRTGGADRSQSNWSTSGEVSHWSNTAIISYLNMYSGLCFCCDSVIPSHSHRLCVCVCVSTCTWVEFWCWCMNVSCLFFMWPVCLYQKAVVEHRSLYSSALHPLITFNHFHGVGHL